MPQVLPSFNPSYELDFKNCLSYNSFYKSVYNFNQNAHTSKVQVTPIHILHHHRLYERYMFFYAVIMSVWLIIASYVFTHYKIDTFTIQQNLALGFLYYLFFAAMIGLTPFWFRITLYRFTETDAYHQSILETLEKSAIQQEYDEMADFLALDF